MQLYDVTLSMLMLYIRVTTMMFQTIRLDDADNLKLSDELAWLIYCLIYTIVNMIL